MLSEGFSAGLEAWVECKYSRKRLEEYQIRYHPATACQSPYTECFLETIDEPFQICITKVQFYKQQNDYSVSVRVDGTELEERVWRKGIQRLIWHDILEERDGSYNKSSLRFAPLPTTDDLNRITIDNAKLKQIGTIEMSIERGWSGPAAIMNDCAVTLNTGLGDEKGKKLAYLVSSTNQMACAQPRSLHYEFYPEEEGRFFHRFIFRYRPRPVLVQMRIIEEEPERPPTPPPRKRKIRDIFERSTSDSEEEDIKPGAAIKRMKYLEEKVKMLTYQLEKSRKVDKGKNDLIDLTLDDDD